MKTILLIEDNEDIIKGLDYLFRENDLLSFAANTIKSAKEYIINKKYDLILLDVTLPDGNGFSFYKENKDLIHVPVIFLTAKDLEDDIVLGLELGAIDYIIKPFHNRELLLRINNALKFKNSNENIIYYKDILVDIDSMTVIKNQELIPLTTLEFKIFLILLKNINKIVTRETILDLIWQTSFNYVNDNTLTVYIKRIREKFRDNDIIKTIKGIGYRIDS